MQVLLPAFAQNLQASKIYASHMQYKKKVKYRQKTPGYFNAIVVIKAEPGAHYTQAPNADGFLFYKYHNIPPNRDRFLQFAAKFPGVQYINFYDAITRTFKERIYLQ